MKERLKFILKVSFVGGVILAMLNMMMVADITSKMDKRELYYDADSYFLMYDQKHHVMGFYDGIHPMKHVGCKKAVPDGTYEAEIIWNEGILLVNDNVQALIRLPKGLQKWVEKNYETGYPAIVYRGQ